MCVCVCVVFYVIFHRIPCYSKAFPAPGGYQLCWCGFLRAPLLGTRSGLCPSFVGRSRRALRAVASVAHAGFCARLCWARALVCVRRLSRGRGEPFGLWPRWPVQVFARVLGCDGIGVGHVSGFASVSTVSCSSSIECCFSYDVPCHSKPFRNLFHAIPSHSQTLEGTTCVAFYVVSRDIPCYSRLFPDP